MANRFWSKEEVDLLKKNHGKMPVSKITQLINKSLREGLNPRTLKQVKNKAFSLGLLITKKEGYVTLKQAAFLTGVSKGKLDNFFKYNKRKNRKIKAYSTGEGGRILISIDDLDKILEIYNPVPPGYITTTEADKMLGNTKCFWELSKRGAVPFVKSGHKVFVPKQIPELARANMLKTGKLIVEWKNVVAEYNRLYTNRAA